MLEVGEVESGLVQDQERLELIAQFPQTPQAYLGQALEEAVLEGGPPEEEKTQEASGERPDEMDPLLEAEEKKETQANLLMDGSGKQEAQGAEEERVDEDILTRWTTERNYRWDSDSEEGLWLQINQPRTEKLGGRLALPSHLSVWKQTCGGHRFIEIGMLPFWKDGESTIRLEALRSEMEYSFNQLQEKAFQELLEEELREGVVVRVRKDQAKFINPVFMVPKSDGKMRKVTDNRRLNAEQKTIPCRMDGAQTVQELSLPSDWATSLDLKSAFNHLRVNESFSPYLCFKHQGVFFCYKAMPFGCRHSPRVFMRALGYPLRYIRAHWQVRVVAYMDDLLLLHQDRDYVRKATLQIALYLASLGWTLSLTKCEFTPQHAIKYLGWRWDFSTQTLLMTQEMRKTLLWRVSQWMAKAVRAERVTCRRLGSLIGCLNFLRSQIPRASLYLRTLHTALAAGVSSSGWNGSVTLGQEIISELQFWWRNISFNSPYDYQIREPQAMLTTDASNLGWGAELEIGSQSHISFGSFSSKESSASSNLRETRAVLRALLYFRDLLKESSVRALTVRTDNMVTVYNLQRQGASKNLLNETRQIFSLLVRLDIRIRVMHIPGVQNTMADALSRMDLVGDYELKQESCDKALQLLGLRPTVDLFANRLNRKCDRFMALPGPQAEGAVALDALLFSWEGEKPYVFPPVQIIPRVLQKLRTEVQEAVMVFPEWPSRPWWSLLQMYVSKQLRLGKAAEVLAKGPSMDRCRALLPPGHMCMARLSFV